MVDPMFMIIQSLRSFLAAVTPTAVTQTAVIPIVVLYLNFPEFSCFVSSEFTLIYFKLSQFTLIYRKLPKFIGVYLNVYLYLPDSTCIYLNFPQFT